MCGLFTHSYGNRAGDCHSRTTGEHGTSPCSCWSDGDQCSEFDVRTNFWSVWTRTWRFGESFGRTVLAFEAISSDRRTQLGNVSFATWVTDRLDADVAF